MKLHFNTSFIHDRRGEIGTIAVLIGMAVVGLGILVGSQVRDQNINLQPRAAIENFPVQIWWTDEGNDTPVDDRIDFVFDTSTTIPCTDTTRQAIRAYDPANNNKDLGTMTTFAPVVPSGYGTTFTGRWPDNNAPEKCYIRFYGSKKDLRLKGLPQYVKLRLPSQTALSNQLDLGSIPEIPNCTNLSGPTTLTVGQTGTYTARVTSAQGELRGEIFEGNFSSIRNQFFGSNATSGNLSGTWRPTRAGTYTISCRAWNDGIAECRPPNLVEGLPQHSCAGPNYQLTVQVVAPTATPRQPTPTNTPSPTPVQRLGNLQITIGGNPPSGAAWRREGTSTWRANGYVERNLPVGYYRVEFKHVSGYSTPGDISGIPVLANRTAGKTSEPYSQELGQLKVIIGGNVPSQANWRRTNSAGGWDAWRNNNFTDSAVPVGIHRIEFSDVKNYDKPPTMANIVVTANKLTTFSSEGYIRHTGTLKVNIPGAPAGAQWKREASNVWRNSGATEKNVPTGNFVIEFKSVSGYDSPGKVSTSLTKNQTRTVTSSEYERQVGSLKVTIGGNIPSGASWRWVKSNGGAGPSRNNNQTDTAIPVGTYSITFDDVRNYNSPPDIKNVVVSANQLTTRTSAAYTRQTGNLRVTIPGAPNGGQWRRTGTSQWRNSGATEQNVPTGNRTIEFRNVSGYTKPPNQVVSIVNNQTRSVNSARYSANPTSTPRPTNTPIPTNTPVPTDRPTNTPRPPTNTPRPPTNTPRPPTVTNTIAPTVDTCPQQAKGDADCNGSIEYVDFVCWRGELVGQKPVNCVSADFNGSGGRPDSVDYGIWASTFLAPLK